MALRPPMHRADAPGRYIHVSDTAWDMDRILKEAEKLKSLDEHPVMRYLAGLTRYDLDAEGVRGYLKPGEMPVVFVLRRLKLQEHTDVLDITAPNARMVRAAQLGVVRVEGAMLCDKFGREDLEQLHDMNPNLPLDLGIAVMNYGRPPSDVEGKRSGSGDSGSTPAEPPSAGSK